MLTETLLMLAVVAAGPSDVACPDLTTGRVHPSEGSLTADVVAPPGWLIDEVCMISVGGVAPVEVPLDPMVGSLTVRTPDGSPIEEYSVSFVVDRTPTEVTQSPQPATIDSPQAARVPGEAPAGERAPMPSSSPVWIASIGVIGVGLVAARWLRRQRLGR